MFAKLKNHKHTRHGEGVPLIFPSHPESERERECILSQIFISKLATYLFVCLSRFCLRAADVCVLGKQDIVVFGRTGVREEKIFFKAGYLGTVF